MWMLVACLVVFGVYTGNTDRFSEASSKTKQTYTRNAKVKTHYAINPFHTKKLAMIEERIAHTFAEVQADLFQLPTNNKKRCVMLISEYLDEFNEETNALNGTSGINAAIIVSENPILIFKMIRRIYITLVRNTLPTCNNDVAHGQIYFTEVLEIIFEKEGLPLPTEQDWRDAKQGILRIQYVYGFNATSAMRLGVFNGIATRAFFGFEDCIALATTAIDMRAAELAYQWIISAKLAIREKKYSPSASVDDLRYDLEVITARLQDLAEVKSIHQLLSKLEGKRQEFLEGFQEYQEYAPCRGEFLFSVETQSQLHCYLTNRHPYNFINPVKTEIISLNPPVLQFYEFISIKFIQYIENYAESHLFHSKAHGAEGDKSANYRAPFKFDIDMTRSSINLESKIIKTFLQQTKYLTNLEVSGERASEFRGTYYGTFGGHYDFRHDAFDPATISIDDANGNILATVLVFTSEPKLGGYTAFRKTFAKPVAGSMLFWYNLNSDGSTNLQTVHADCPVILGKKAVVHHLIHQYPNMWKFPCTYDNQNKQHKNMVS